MAKKATTIKATTKTAAPAKTTATSTAVRNTPIPKVAAIPTAAIAAAPAPKILSQADIAKRAFEISISGCGGDEMHNWLQAERELGV